MDEFYWDFCILFPLFLGTEPSCNHQGTSETSGSFSPSKTWIKMELEGRPTMFTLCLHTWHSLTELYIIIWQHLFIRRKRHAESQRAQKGSLCVTENKADNENFQFHGSVEGVCCPNCTLSPGWGSGFCHGEPVNPCGHSWSDVQVWHKTAEVRASPLISLQLLCSWNPILQPFTSQNKQSPLSEVFCFLEIVGSLKLEKTLKVTNHHYQLSTMFSTKLCPQLPTFMISEQCQEWWLCRKSVGARRRRWTGQKWKAAPKCWEALRDKPSAVTCVPLRISRRFGRVSWHFQWNIFSSSLSCFVFVSCLVCWELVLAGGVVK